MIVFELSKNISVRVSLSFDGFPEEKNETTKRALQPATGPNDLHERIVEKLWGYRGQPGNKGRLGRGKKGTCFALKRKNERQNERSKRVMAPARNDKGGKTRCNTKQIDHGDTIMLFRMEEEGTERCGGRVKKGKHTHPHATRPAWIAGDSNRPWESCKEEIDKISRYWKKENGR